MYIDGYLKSNLDIIQNEAIPNKWDALSIFFGIEGSGKSTLAFQCAHYLDRNFSLDNVVFTPEQFSRTIDSCKPESSIVWDESITGANVMMFANKVSVSIISKLTQIRKKRLKIFLCFPYLWMINKYFLSRCLFATYTHAKNFNDRGYFKFYGSKKIQYVYWLMKERFPYYPDAALKEVLPSFRGVFTNEFMINEEEYDAKKEQSRVNTDDSENVVDNTMKKPTYMWKQRALALAKEMSASEVAKSWNLQTATVRKAMEDYDNKFFIKLEN